MYGQNGLYPIHRKHAVPIRAGRVLLARPCPRRGKGPTTATNSYQQSITGNKCEEEHEGQIGNSHEGKEKEKRRQKKIKRRKTETTIQANKSKLPAATIKGYNDISEEGRDRGGPFLRTGGPVDQWLYLLALTPLGQDLTPATSSYQQLPTVDTPLSENRTEKIAKVSAPGG